MGGSLASVLRGGGLSERQLRAIVPFAILVALMCSMIGHGTVRWIRKMKEEKNMKVDLLTEYRDEKCSFLDAKN